MFGRKRTSTDLDQDGVRSDIETGLEDLNALFEVIESFAQRLYIAHGLPGQIGHYQRTGEDQKWTLVSEVLTPAEKFDLVLNAAEQGQVRYAAHDRLGADHPNADVRKASALLAACRGLRQRLGDGDPMDSQTLADAIRLGALYQDLASGRSELGTRNILHQPPSPRLD